MIDCNWCTIITQHIYDHFLNNYAIFFTKFSSIPRFFTFSSKSLSFLLVSIIKSNLFSIAAYWTKRSLMLYYFSANCCLRLSTSFSLLFSLSSKYSLMLTSWVPKNAFILTLSSSMAAFDSNCKLSINPLDNPSSWASEALTSCRC